MVMGKMHESLSKCIYCSFAGVMAEVWSALMQAGRVSLNIKLGNEGGKKGEKKNGLIYGKRIPHVSDFRAHAATRRIIFGIVHENPLRNN